MNNQSANHFIRFLETHFSHVKSLVIFCLTAAIFYLFVQYFRGLDIYGYYVGALTSASSNVLSTIRLEHTLAQAFLLEHKDMIVTDIVNVRLAVDKDYDGLIPLALVCAAMLAWPTRAVAKMGYFLLAIIVMLPMAVLRIVCDVSADQYFPLHYEILHFYLNPTLLIFMPILLLFIAITKHTGR